MWHFLESNLVLLFSCFLLLSLSLIPSLHNFFYSVRAYLSVSLPFTFLICFSPLLSASLPFLPFLLSFPLSLFRSSICPLAARWRISESGLRHREVVHNLPFVWHIWWSHKVRKNLFLFFLLLLLFYAYYQTYFVTWSSLAYWFPLLLLYHYYHYHLSSSPLTHAHNNPPPVPRSSYVLFTLLSPQLHCFAG